MSKRKVKERTFWLVRDKRGAWNEPAPYALFGSPEMSLGQDGYWGEAGEVIADMTAPQLHAHCDVRLKPGGGPIEVKLVVCNE